MMCFVGFTWDEEDIEIYGEEAWQVMKRAEQIQRELGLDEYSSLTRAIQEHLGE
jgi:hypothetical protein